MTALLCAIFFVIGVMMGALALALTVAAGREDDEDAYWSPKGR